MSKNGTGWSVPLVFDSCGRQLLHDPLLTECEWLVMTMSMSRIAVGVERIVSLMMAKSQTEGGQGRE